MAYDIIKKNVYFDPPDEFLHSSRNHAEDLRDFHVPMHKLSNAAAHGRGVAAGLEVTGAPGAMEVVIDPGVAIDGVGNLIVLASPTSTQSNSGRGDISPMAPGDLEPVPVPVHLPLAAMAGRTVYVTIQFSEILDPMDGSGGRKVLIPWIRLQPTAGAGAYVDDGSSVILGIAVINAAGNLTSLAASDGAIAFGRATLGVPASEVRVRRSLSTANKLQETQAGKLRAGVGGGLVLSVPAAADKITMQRESGAHFSTLEAHAATVSFTDNANRDVFHFDTNNSWLRIGAVGNEGDLVILDQRGNEGLAFTSSTARLDIGTNQNAGHFNMRNASATITMSLDGATGAVKTNSIVPFSGSQVTVTATQLHAHCNDLVLDGRSNAGNRALMDSNNLLVINPANSYSQGVRIDGRLLGSDFIPLNTSTTRKVRMVNMFVPGGGTTSLDVDLGTSKPFFAYVAVTMIDPLIDFDRDNCVGVDVHSVDGNNSFATVSGGDHWGPSGADSNLRTGARSGTGRVIRFRLRSFGSDCSVSAVGVVFHE